MEKTFGANVARPPRAKQPMPPNVIGARKRLQEGIGAADVTTGGMSPQEQLATTIPERFGTRAFSPQGKALREQELGSEEDPVAMISPQQITDTRAANFPGRETYETGNTRREFARLDPARWTTPVQAGASEEETIISPSEVAALPGESQVAAPIPGLPAPNLPLPSGSTSPSKVGVDSQGMQAAQAYRRFLGPDAQTEFGPADATQVAKYEEDLRGSYAGTGPGGNTFNTVPAYNPELAQQQNRIALLKKWRDMPLQDRLPGEVFGESRGPMPGSEAEAARMSPEVFSVGGEGGHGMFSNKYRDERNRRVTAGNTFDDTVRRARNAGVKGAALGRVISTAAKIRAGSESGAAALESKEEVARIGAEAGSQKPDRFQVATFENELRRQREEEAEERRKAGKAVDAQKMQQAQIAQERRAQGFKDREAIIGSDPEARLAWSQLAIDSPPEEVGRIMTEAMAGDPELPLQARIDAIKIRIRDSG